MREQYVARRDALRQRLRAEGLDALLVTSLVNVRYLTGFTGSNAALLMHAEYEHETIFGTDMRYETQSQFEVPDLRRMVERPTTFALVRHAESAPKLYRRLGFESQHVSVDAYETLAGLVDAVQLAKASNLVEESRVVKDDTEIAALRKACAIADRAFTDLLASGQLRPGRTELEVARALENLLREHGATDRAFETILATGSNTAIPHHSPGHTVLAPHDFVMLDFGALFDGYHSDMTRMVVLGEPSTWQRESYELVHQAQAAGREALRPGTEISDVYLAAYQVFDQAGYGARFVYGLGHSVGLEIHEPPIIGRNAVGKLRSGMTVTVEPGIYFAGQGGVRIEDTLVVRDDAPELLTMSGKELVVV